MAMIFQFIYPISSLAVVANRLNASPKKIYRLKIPLQIFTANFANNDVALES